MDNEMKVVDLINSLTEKLKKAEAENQKLRNDIEEKDKSIESLRRIVQSDTSKIENAGKHLSAMGSALEAAGIRWTPTYSRRGGITYNLELPKSTNDTEIALKDTIEVLEKENKILKGDVKMRDNNIEALKRLYTSAKDRSACYKDYVELQKDYAKLVNENDNLKSDGDKLWSNNADLSKQVENWKYKTVAYKKDLASKNSELATAWRRTDELDAQLARLEKELDRRDGIIHYMRTKSDQIKTCANVGKYSTGCKEYFEKIEELANKLSEGGEKSNGNRDD